MTFASILADCYRMLRYATAPEAKVITRIKYAVNEVQQELASEPALASLLRGSLTFATTADRAEYGLPPVIARVIAVREGTNNRRLRAESLDWYRTQVTDQDEQTGTPSRYVPLGPKAVQRQPSDASELFAKSTAAGDTQVLYYEVRTTDGVRTGQVTLTGTTAVSLSATITTIEEVLDLYLATAAVGAVTLHEDSGVGTELAKVNIGQTRSRYEWVAFAPTPSDAITYTLDYERDATDLVNDSDEPAWLPSRFHRLLGVGARKKEYEGQDDGRHTTAAQEYEKERRKLLAYVNNPPDQVMVPGGSRRGVSDLGGSFPAGTIFD